MYSIFLIKDILHNLNERYILQNINLLYELMSSEGIFTMIGVFWIFTEK